MLRRIAAALFLVGSLDAHAGTRELTAGLENYWYRTATTPLNRDNALGLDNTEDLLRGTLSWKESRGAARLLLKGYAERSLGSKPGSSWTTREAYLQYGWGPGLSVRLGKQRVAWGSGFAWNPSNRLDAPKNPANTSLEQEGAPAVRLDVLPTGWAGLILVASRSDPRTGDLPFGTGGGARNTGALRARVLVKDTDLALVVSGGQRQPTLFGLDVGRDARGVALHAEASVSQGSELAPARPARRFFRIAAGALWARNTTSLSAEYFFNAEGYDDAQAEAYLGRLDQVYTAATAPGQPAAIKAALLQEYLAGAAVPYRGGLGLRRHYLYAAWTRSPIAGTWTAAVRGIVGLSDRGVALTPGVAWAPRGDLTISLDSVILLGPATSEYRLAPLRGAIQARVRALF
jgi:hypothetical protein